MPDLPVSPVSRRAILSSGSLRPLVLLSGFLGRAVTQFVILWVFAHESGPAGAGQFAFALAVSSPVFVVFELALRNVYQTLHDAPSFRLFFTVRLVCAALAVGCVTVAAAAVSGFPSSRILLPLLAMKFADTVLDICLARFLVQGRVGVAAGHLWANTLLTVGAISVTFVVGSGAVSAVVGSALASALVAAVAALPLLVRAEAVVGPIGGKLRRVLRAGVLLGGAQALLSLLVYLPTVYLEIGATTAAVGVFAVCQYAVTLGTMFYNSAMQTWLSRLREAHAAGGRRALDRQWRQVATYITVISVIGGVLTLAFLAPVIRWGFGEEFAVSVTVVLPLALVIVVTGVEYAATTKLLVLNLYGTRAVSGLTGLAAALLFAAATISHASVALAGYMALAGVLGRCAFSLVQLARNRHPRTAGEATAAD